MTWCHKTFYVFFLGKGKGQKCERVVILDIHVIFVIKVLQNN